MKKRLLITSIVMMLVVAVALSTATYAWFTSSASVTSSSITMTAATNDAASLGISWTDGNYGPSITAVGPVNGEVSGNDFFKPACPSDLSIGTTKLGDESGNVVFNTAFATPSGGDMVFLADGAETDVYTWNDGTGAGKGHTSFFVKNLSPANTIGTVRLIPTITGEGASLVRVGVFKKVEGVYKLQAVLAIKDTYTYENVAASTVLNTNSGAVTYYKKYLGKYVEAVAGTAAAVANGTADFEDGVTQAVAGKFFTRTNTATYAKATFGEIEEGQPVNSMSSITTVEYVDIASNLAAGGTVELMVLVWEDAVALGDAEHGLAATVDFEIRSV